MSHDTIKCSFCFSKADVNGNTNKIEINNDYSPVIRGGFYHLGCLERKAQQKERQATLIRSIDQ